MLLLQKRERSSELCMQAVGAIAHDWQTAALLRTILSKCRHDHMTARLDGAQNRQNVGCPLLRQVRK